jgi:raffinose/stachyose/melibiose transport system permease protein
MSAQPYPRRRRPIRPGKTVVFVLLALVGATTLYPLYVMAVDALKSRTEYYSNVYGPPKHLFLGNFNLLMENFDILGALLRSLFVVCIAVVVATFVASLASFALAKIPFRMSNTVFFVAVALLLVPGQVLVIPVYLFFAKLQLIDNFLSVILIYVATSLPFGTFLLTSNFRAIPDELIESARIDGASMWRTFWSIVLPVGRPAVMTLVILSFLSMWNELLLALMLIPDEARRLLTPTITTLMGRYLTNQPLLMTGLLFSSIPTIVAFVVFSRHIVRGVTLGVAR